MRRYDYCYKDLFGEKGCTCSLCKKKRRGRIVKEEKQNEWKTKDIENKGRRGIYQQ